jgi:hemerythrin-like domain-containing protein
MAASPAGIDTHEMLLIHRVIRREIGALPGLVRAAAGNPQRSKVVGAHAKEMLEFLHVHHSGEDELLWPVLRPRVRLEDDLLDRMAAQHAQIAEAIDAVQAELPGWTASADPEAGERMATRLEAATEVLLAHLKEEEERILPLVAEHFSPDEWAALGKHGFGAIPGNRRLVILGHILAETDDSERAKFLLNVPPPARLAYRLIGRRQYAREVATIRGA